MEKKNIYQKMTNIMGRVDSVFKGVSVKAGYTNYTAVSHDDVTKLLHKEFVAEGVYPKPSMIEHELEVFTNAKGNKVFNSRAWTQVDFINVDKPEELITTKCFSMAMDSQDKGPGKAYSMGVKYCYLKAFALESTDNEEARDVGDIKKNASFRLPEGKIDKIKEALGAKCKGMAPKDKADYLERVSGTRSFGDLSGMSDGELDEILTKIKE